MTMDRFLKITSTLGAAAAACECRRSAWRTGPAHPRDRAGPGSAMMRRHAGAVLLALCGGAAQAQYLVDTGPPAADLHGLGLWIDSPLAATFTFAQDVHVTGIEAYFVNLSLYSSAHIDAALSVGDQPGAAAVWTSSGDALPAITYILGQPLYWTSLFSGSLSLQKGTYTLVLSTAQPEDHLVAAAGVPNPLPAYWARGASAPQDAGWGPAPLDFALRISGTPASSVPEPGPAALLAAGALALLLVAGRLGVARP